jgi:hypothetical protein
MVLFVDKNIMSNVSLSELLINREEFWTRKQGFQDQTHESISVTVADLNVHKLQATVCQKQKYKLIKVVTL